MNAENYAIVDGEGNILNIAFWDGEAPWDPGEGLIAVRCGESRCSIGGRYENGVFYDPPQPELPPIDYVANAEAEKKNRMDEIALSIAVWQTKLLIGRKLTASETAQLNDWLDYSDLLVAVDTSKAPDIEWPERPS